MLRTLCLLALAVGPQTAGGITAKAFESAEVHALEKGMPSFEELKHSVLRIQVFKKKFYWSRPFDEHFITKSLGSGFLVSTDPPIICTCAHVVTGSDSMFVQVTEYGQTAFAAKIATINHDADVAIIVPKYPKYFLGKMKDANISMRPLKLATHTPTLGHNVVAPGFPLGQKTMTLSMGVISGVDHVAFHHTNLALQSTAMISAGNSGSPLLDGETREIIGMNYAKMPGEAQINYAVPLWRLKQVILKHQQVHVGKNAEEIEPYEFRLVNHGLVLTAASDVLYMLSESKAACSSGPMISGINPDSPFSAAKPSIHADMFLVSVDGVKLDRFGQGNRNKDGYVEDKVDFEDLMWMRGGTGEQDIKFQVCDAKTGEVSDHTMNLAWSWDREGKGVRYVYDARLDKVDWEIFSDLVFMDLTENHVQLLNGDFHRAALVRFLEPEERQTPKLAVMLHKAGGDAELSLSLTKGADLAIVEEINGHKVSCVADLRKYFMPDGLREKTNKSSSFTNLWSLHLDGASQLNKDSQSGSLRGSDSLQKKRNAVHEGKEFFWSLRTAGGKEYVALFIETLGNQAASAASTQYVMTPAAKAAMQEVGFFKDAHKAALLEDHRPAAPASPATLLLPEDGAAMHEAMGRPLEAVQRDSGAVVVDFQKDEDVNVW